MLSRSTYFCIGLLVMGTGVALADPGLVPPSGWTHVDQTGATDPQRSFDTWKASSNPGAQTLTLIRDSSSTYGDAVARVKKNFADNNIHPSMDNDLTCQGKPSHVFEFMTGPESARFVVNRTIVPITTGVLTVTYVRAQSQSFSPDVKTAITAFCNESPAAAAAPTKP